MKANTYGFNQVVVRDLREKMVNDMGSNVVVDIVDPSVIPIKGS